VHEGVDPANEGAMSAGIVLAGAPADHGHHRVMVDMQEGHLSVILAQHKENGVQQLGNLGQIVDIDDARLTIRLGCAGPINRLAPPAVVLPDDHALVDHPNTEGYLEEIVDEQGAFQLEGFAILHELGSPGQHEEEIEGQDAQQGQWRLDQEPVIGAGICVGISGI